MDIRILKYFLIVARERNITKAAQLLHLTQPTLSRQIALLEEELGTELFKRSNHSIYLTDDGLLLKRRAEEIVMLEEKTKHEFKHDGQLSGEISIGSGDFRSSRLLCDIAARFQKEYPLIQFEFFTGNSDNIKGRIERGSLDMGLLMEPVDISKYQYIRMPVKEEWGVLVCEDSPLAALNSVTPGDISGLPLIFSARETVQNQILNWFGEQSSGLNIVANGNLPYNLAMLVRSGAGIFMNLKLECEYDGIKFIPLNPCLESWTVLTWKRIDTFSAATEEFIKYAKKYVDSITDHTK